MLHAASVTAVVLLVGLRSVHAGPETHSLTYIYTAFARPVGLPGIHEFSAVGLLDGRPIDYYDSTRKVKEPREPWMAERLDQEYWDKGTSSRRTKQQWFKVNLDILTKRLKRNDTVNHVLQWRHGCQVRYDDAGVKQAVAGTDQYSYDGDDFLSFDSTHKQWVAPMNEAIQTKRKWDLLQQLNDYTLGYLTSECVQWLDHFRQYRKEAITKARPPKVYVYAKNYEQHLRLTCLATGFYPKEIIMVIKRNGQPLELADGLESSQVRPNGDSDGTHQKKIWVLIPKSDGANYDCEVSHPATGLHVVKEWGNKVEAEDNMGALVGPIVGGVLAAVLVASILIGWYCCLKRKKTSRVMTVSSAKLEEKAPLKGGSMGSDGDSVMTVSSAKLEEKAPLKGGSTGSDGDSGNVSAQNSPTGSTPSLQESV